MILKFTVSGTPVAKKRPRFVRRGKNVHAYNCQETEEGRFLWEITRQLPQGFSPIGGPVIVVILAIFQRPKSHYGTGRNHKKLRKSAPVHHCVRADVDNIGKFVLDCLQPTIIMDDKQVVSLIINKEWGESGETIVIVEDYGGYRK